ncbi:hypothetical protein BKA93DRAFT_742614 [Sparassis latifolia]
MIDTSASAATYSAPPLDGSSIPVVTSTPSSTSSVNLATSSPASASSASSGSNIPIGTVIGACVGAFAGLTLLLFLCVFCCKRHNREKSRGDPSSLGSTRGNADQPRNRDSTWKRLNGDNEDKWEGMPGKRDVRRDTEMTEKNFSMFKKSPSIYTTRTAKTISDEDHGYDLPPFEFSKYHPSLAAELALQQPPRPFTERQDSGVSWGGSTAADESFLSLHSMRADSGTMSPTMVMAKMTPPTTSSPVHKWESAEVLTMGKDDMAGPREVQNPFMDVHEERRSVVANPFFNAQEMQRSRTLTRSRSNSRTSRTRSVSQGHSRNTSHSTIGRSQSFRASNPFIDVHEIPVSRIAPPAAIHVQHDSVASGSSANLFGDHAMRSLIAALEMTQEEVEERLRVVSMQASTISGVSSLTGLDDEETDIATVRKFPMPPAGNRSSP